MHRYLEVYTTTDDRQEAEKIAVRLLELRLAACVQIVGPVRSIYRWKGAVESTEEWLCIVKTEDALYERLQEAITEMHHYETPQILALPVLHGSAPYLNWLREELSGT